MTINTYNLKIAYGAPEARTVKTESEQAPNMAAAISQLITRYAWAINPHVTEATPGPEGW